MARKKVSDATRTLAEIAMHLCSIAQSLREQTEIQKRQQEKEQAKTRRPRILGIGQAKYPDQPGQPTGAGLPWAEAGAEVPGFRRR